MKTIKLTDGSDFKMNEVAYGAWLSFPEKINGKTRQFIFTKVTDSDNARDYSVIYGDDRGKLFYVAYVLERKGKWEIAVSDIKRQKEFFV